MDFLKDLTGIAVSLVGIYVAVSGLNTWKKQLKWKEDHQLAKDILITLTKYQNAVHQVRNPAIFEYEKIKVSNDIRHTYTSEQVEFIEHESVYVERLKPVSQYHSELQALSIEADALWGKNITDLLKEIFNLELKLALAIRSHLLTMNPKISEAQKKYHIEKTPETDKVIYFGISSDDEFLNEFNEKKDSLVREIQSKI
ncbi:hypothetical protein [Proteus mirabilis]|uniref:hypothetical protein n=1 Tax=Proteus mirabilis TaxID=584 RepID=UPI0033159F6A